MITAKFGGTSLCDAAHFQMVRDILALKEERRFVVVSAPGKRFPEDIKITDQLYRCHEEARQGGNVAEAWTWRRSSGPLSGPWSGEPGRTSAPAGENTSAPGSWRPF